MIRLVKYAVLAVIALILLLFAFANLQKVTISFDPFATTDGSAYAFEAPLFAVMIVFAALGVVAGAFATWLSQGRHRRASRQNRAEAAKWRTEAQTLKAAQPSPPVLPRR
ncbi:MAG: LapA family protein [Roseiarcus sp.]|jgi:uncharacterized integral membrane protein|uniref:lipopolysaccharide assembly protein LapA domain-containing protein n=1 Tax=Roseiarcus sp. TaxID=1969460 RepID=UPI003BB063DD